MEPPDRMPQKDLEVLEQEVEKRLKGRVQEGVNLIKLSPENLTITIESSMYLYVMVSDLWAYEVI